MRTSRENGTFYTEYIKPNRPVGTWRDELERAVKIRCTKPVMLSLSSGLDSQLLLVTLSKLNIPFQAVYLDLIGHNQEQLSRVNELENRWGFKTDIVSVDPDSIKDKILDEATERSLPPNHLIHREFLSLLDKDKDFLIGLEGPDLVFEKSTNKSYVLEANNSFENTRLRILHEINRSGKIINIDKDPTDDDGMLYSILTDEVYAGFVASMQYTFHNNLQNENGEKLDTIWYWNYYLKPIMMGKHWGNDLVYYPKLSGIETINWLKDCPIMHDYSKDKTYTDYTRLVNFLRNGKDDTVRVYSSL
jgi:hypothetical protein